MAAPRLIEALTAHRIVGVAAGGRHSCFLTAAGECFVAGSNHSGQCGLGFPAADEVATGARPTAAAVRRMRLPEECAALVQASAGQAHTLLLCRKGRAYACGANDHGQCGVETDGACVGLPTLISGLLPHAVKAVEAGSSLSVFEVETKRSRRTVRGDDERDIEGDGESEGEGEDGGDGGDGDEDGGNDSGSSGGAGAGAGALAAGCAAGSGDELERAPSLWLAGNVEAFNIPGTTRQAGGLRFLPSCYQWQHR